MKFVNIANPIFLFKYLATNSFTIYKLLLVLKEKGIWNLGVALKKFFIEILGQYCSYIDMVIHMTQENKSKPL